LFSEICFLNFSIEDVGFEASCLDLGAFALGFEVFGVVFEVLGLVFSAIIIYNIIKENYFFEIVNNY